MNTVTLPGQARPAGKWTRHRAKTAMCAGCTARQDTALRRGLPTGMRRPVAWRHIAADGSTTDFCESCKQDCEVAGVPADEVLRRADAATRKGAA